MHALSEPPTLIIDDEDAMTDLGQRLAMQLQPGDTILLRGPIGAGKTHLARAIIKTLIGEDEEIPSPTYTLVQTYDASKASVWHADLYRLGDSSELIELGLDEAIGEAIVLIEWPDRLPEGTHPKEALDISISVTGETRKLELSSNSDRWNTFLQDVVHG